MSLRRPRSLRSFAHHLVLASASYAFIALMGAGAVQLARWALALESASSSPQRALFATHEILRLHEAFWISAAVSIAAVCFAAIWLARHITGPLTRFTAAFGEIARGGVPHPFAIRSTDYLGDELAAFNAMTERLAERERETDAAHGALAGELDELAALARERGDAELADGIQRALALAKRAHASGARRGAA